MVMLWRTVVRLCTVTASPLWVSSIDGAYYLAYQFIIKSYND